MIREATLGDHEAIAVLAADVYSELGDYGSILPSWFTHPQVKIYVDFSRETLRSFLLLGFFEPLGLGSPDKNRLMVDLLAIAVVPSLQKKGHGRGLLRKAIELANSGAKGFADADLRLTVSESNPVAHKLFASEGFTVLDWNHGSYHFGQRAIRMSRVLETA